MCVGVCLCVISTLRIIIMGQMSKSRGTQSDRKENKIVKKETCTDNKRYVKKTFENYLYYIKKILLCPQDTSSVSI